MADTSISLPSSADLIERLREYRMLPALLGEIPAETACEELAALRFESADALAAKDTALSEAIERNQKLGLLLNDAHAAYHRAEARATAAEAALSEMRAELERAKLHLSAWEDSARINNARATAAEAQLERARKALATADEAIAEYIRYLDGGEMRGSYDGKPERDQLRKAGYAVRAARALASQDEGEER